MAHEEVRGERVMLQLSLPAYAGKLIEARVRHRSRFDRALVSGELETMFYCGLEFLRVLEESSVHPSLVAAFSLPENATQVLEPAGTRISDRSLVPLLSAFGMPVVYASFQLWN
jgi:hypothetical protein